MDLVTNLIILMNLSFGASWIVFMVLLLRWILKNAPVSQRIFLWLFVGLRLVSGWVLPLSPVSVIPNLKIIPENITKSKVPAIDSGLPVVNSVVNPVIEKNFTPATEDLVTPMQQVMDIAVIVWGVGVIAMLLYALISFGKLRRRIREATTLNGNILICDHIDTPFILGIIRPKIYIPSYIIGTEMEYVITHEKSHIKRGDHIWKLIGYLLLSIYWFNPILWLAFNLFCKDIELACDVKTLKKSTNLYKKQYSAALIECSSSKRKIITCPLAFSENAVESRIKSILNYRKPKLWIASVGAFVCFLMSFVSFSGSSSFAGNYDYQEVIDNEFSLFIENQLLERAYYKDNDEIEWFTEFKVLDIKENDREITAFIYADTMGFKLNNGYVERAQHGWSSGIIAITAIHSKGNYELVEFWQSGEGEMLWKSVKEKFPYYLYNYLLYNSGGISSELVTKLEIEAQEKLSDKTSEECFIDDESEAIEIAKKLCTIKYDEISVEYFSEGWSPKQYEVIFLKNGGSEYGEQSVWITENGVVSGVYYN